MSRTRNRFVALGLTLATLAWLAGLGSAVALAQTVQFGKIVGTVHGPGGETLPGVEVALTSEALVSGQRSATSSAEGGFVLLNLPNGTYSLTATLPGFKSHVQQGIEVSAGVTVEVDVPLEVGGIEEEITVSSTPVFDTKTSA